MSPVPTARPRTCASSSPCSPLTAPPYSQPSAVRQAEAAVAAGAVAAGTDAVTRAQGLAALAEQVARCTRCPLHATRTQAVFGAGHPDADLMFVGEAPG